LLFTGSSKTFILSNFTAEERKFTELTSAQNLLQNDVKVESYFIGK